MSTYYYIELAYEAIAGAHAEICAFILAFLAHQLLFGKMRIPIHVNKKVPQSMFPAPSPQSQKSSELHKIKLAANSGSSDNAIATLQSVPLKSSEHYNALMDGLIRSGSADAVDKVMSEAKVHRLADIGTFNLFLKAQSCDLKKARDVLREMRALGVEPNATTFNEVLNAAVRGGSHNGVKDVLEEMRTTRVRPNRVTCAILLKSAQHVTDKSYVRKVLTMVDEIDGDMDEVLLSSVIEACIRTEQSNMLFRILQNVRERGQIQLKSSHAYGSLIRAYGYIQDMPRAWDTWREIRTRRVDLTSVTVGCMVEAVVQNGDPEGAYDLVRELSEDPLTKPLLNAVVYCSVLKGFSHQKRFERVMAVYEDMLAQTMKPTIVTYNALMDACARCKEMVHIPGLLDAMGQRGIEPNVITYSTVVKGYCEQGELQQALSVMEEMKAHAQTKPDEHTFNTVINGCARSGLCEKGYQIFNDMIAAGVRPTNFTLSVLVKLAGRGRQMDKAFELCEEFVEKYGVSLNMHVYNNLLQVCVIHKSLRRAIEVFRRMLRERVRPDARTYKLLLQVCTDVGELQEAAGFLRAAFGLRDVHPCLAGLPVSMFGVHGGLPPDVTRDVLQVFAKRCSAEPWVRDLAKDLSTKGCKLDSKLRAQLLHS